MILVKRGYFMVHSTAKLFAKSFSIEAAKPSDEKYKLVIVGAGAGGLATGSKLN